MFHRVYRKAETLAPIKAASSDKREISSFVSIAQHLVLNDTPVALDYFFEDLLAQQNAGKVSATELLCVFEAESPEKGVTNLQWMIGQHRSKMTRAIFKMLNAMERIGIIAFSQLLDLLCTPNAYGRSAYYYTLRSNDRMVFGMAAVIAYRAFKEKAITVEDFHQILARKDKRGAPQLSLILLGVSPSVLRFYFYQWENSLALHPQAYPNLVAALTAPYSITTIHNTSFNRTPCMDALDSGEAEVLDLYLKQLRSCYTQGVLSKKSYFDTLTTAGSASERDLFQGLVKKNHPFLLARYLQELLFCAKEGMASFQELKELFARIEVDNQADNAELTQELIAHYLSEIRALERAIDQLVAKLPGLQYLNGSLAASKEIQFVSNFKEPLSFPVSQGPSFYSLFAERKSRGEVEAKGFQSSLALGLK
jgi:hypothetical protein